MPKPAPAWSEARLALEPLRMLRDAPSLRRAPRGDGPVMVLPGYRTSDRATVLLRRWLLRLGYRVHGWGLGVNDGPIDPVLPRLGARLDTLGPPVALVGWSWGGVIARALARSAPELVSQVITLGTPLQGGVASTVFDSRADDEGRRRTAAAAALRESAPLAVPATSIYTRYDGVVAWQASLDPVDGRTEHVEVDSCHVGLIVNPAAWIAIADRLARR